MSSSETVILYFAAVLTYCAATLGLGWKIVSKASNVRRRGREDNLGSGGGELRGVDVEIRKRSRIDLRVVVFGGETLFWIN